MRTLSLDIETYSEADLRKVGVYRYADDPSFDILLFSYAIDGGEISCIDLTATELPLEVVQLLLWTLKSLRRPTMLNLSGFV